MHFPGVVLRFIPKNFAFLYFQLSVKLFQKIMKLEIFHCCQKYIFLFFSQKNGNHHSESERFLHNYIKFRCDMLKNANVIQNNLFCIPEWKNKLKFSIFKHFPLVMKISVTHKYFFTSDSHGSKLPKHLKMYSLLQYSPSYTDFKLLAII